MTSTALTFHRRPGLLGRSVMDDVFDTFFSDFPAHLKQSTQGYPVADIFKDDSGNTVLEFALAGFTKDQLSIDVLPEKGTITVAANAENDVNSTQSRRIARRSFTKSYVNYDRDLDLSAVSAQFDNGLLSIIVPQRAEAQPLSISID